LLLRRIACALRLPNDDLGYLCVRRYLRNVSSNQHQHYLPQSYQRGWAGTSGRPYVYRWAYNKLVCEPKATRSTGGRDGLYFTPMAPPGKQNFMEDVFWKKIDQWGADGLALLRSNDPMAPAKLQRDRLAIFLISFFVRNPRMVEYWNAWAKKSVLSGCLKDDYATHRRAHEPATFEEFKAALEQPGMTELAAQCLRQQVLNKAIRKQILRMRWQVVTVPTTNDPILTSDVPIIIQGGLGNDDGCLILPLSTGELFVAYNLGKIDMKKEISESVASGRFVRAVNKYVIEHRADYVYGIDDSLMPFVKQHWGVSGAPHFPSLLLPPDTSPG